MFTTPVQVVESPIKIDLQSNILCMGSCFAEHIGHNLSIYKFKSITNPFGILFNPLSLIQSLDYAIHDGCPPTNSFLVQQDIHYNYHFHSQMSALSKDELQKQIKKAIHQIHQDIAGANWLILTFGTAIIYQLKDSGMLVANCHKVPGDQFKRRILEPIEIIEAFDQFIQELTKINPGVHIILTVSPVRHLKEGLQDNSISKSALRYSCHKISNGHERVFYFPAFEIFMDELRDYRYYGEDMLHPSEVAIDFTWQRFITAFMSEPAQKFIEEWSKIKKSLEHRPFHPNSDRHQTFLQNLLYQIESLPYPVNTDQEINWIRKQLS